MSLGKCKLKHQSDTITHRLKRPVSGRGHQMLIRMWSKKNFHSLFLGLQSDTATLGDNVAVSYKPNILLSHDPAIAVCGIYWYLKELKPCPRKNLPMDVCSSFFIIGQLVSNQHVLQWENRQINCGTCR